MSNSGSPRSIAVSVWLYRVLLQVYPRHFRQKYSQEMLQVFQALCQEVYVRGKSGGVLKLWPAILSDLFITAIRQHRSNLQGKQVLITSITYILALSFAILIGYVNLHNNEVQAPAALLLIFSFSFGLALPRAAWRWGFLFGLSIPLSYFISHLIGYIPAYKPVPNEISTTFVLIPALIATYGGVFMRLLVNNTFKS